MSDLRNSAACQRSWYELQWFNNFIWLSDYSFASTLSFCLAIFYIANTVVLMTGLCFLRLPEILRPSTVLSREMWLEAISSCLPWINVRNLIYFESKAENFNSYSPLRLADLLLF